MGLRARLFAVAYDAMIARADRAGLGSLRSQLLRRASGDVLEIGAGTGNNLAHYTPAADHITLTEPDPSMLRRLTKRTETWTRSSTVLRAPAENLPFDDATFDTVVSVLVLCGVDDQFLAVREIRRVLRPAGRLLFIEHVRSDDAVLARQQDRCNWISRLTAGCDCNRPTRRTLEHGGLAITECTGGHLPGAPYFARPLISGVATRVPDIDHGSTTGPSSIGAST